MTTTLRLACLVLLSIGCLQVARADEQTETPAADPYVALVKDARVDRGTFTTIRTPAGKHYLEIPAPALGRDMLWYAEIAEAPAIVGGAGLGAMGLSSGKEIGHRAVRLEQRGNQLLVRDMETGLSLRSGPEGSAPRSEPVGTRHNTCDCHDEPLRSAISHASILPILRAVPIVARGPRGSVVVDADPLFLASLPAMDAKDKVIGATAMDSARSFVDEVRAVGPAVDVTMTLTYAVDSATVPPPLKKLLGTIESTAATIEVRHSLMLLPPGPMQPRAFDDRVGFFKTAYQAPSEGSVQPVERRIICRFRLEKKDPQQAVSDPVKPIVFLMSDEIPARWRPYVKRGVENWQPCFEHAGFSNAIVARPAPTDDPDWNPASLQHNVIRWVGLPVKNAQGPKVIDPRTGEILAAHVVVWNDVIDAFADTYFLLSSSVDENARTLPLSEEIRGKILEYAIMHEVGHSIGLRHNFRASQAFTIAELRDPAFTSKHGSVASVMSYGRMNYVAQPGDGVTRVMPDIGPYDKWAIHWGYAPIPGADGMEAEVPTLTAWASEAATNRMLPYASEDGDGLVFDPRILRENLGDDRIEAARLGIENLKRVIARLPGAVASLPTRRSERIRALHGAALDKRKTWLLAASKQLYGTHVEATDRDAPRARTRLDRPLREATLAFLLGMLEADHGLVTPGVAAAYAPHVLAEAVVSHQVSLLDALLDGKVFQAALHDEVLGREAWSAHDYLGRMRAGLFREFQDGAATIDPVRRAVQRRFVTRLGALDKPPPQTDDEKLIAQIMGEPPPAVAPAGAAAQARLVLADLAKQLKAASTDASPPAVRAHVQDLLRRMAAAGIQ